MKSIETSYQGKNVTIITKSGSTIKGTVENQTKSKIILNKKPFVKSRTSENSCASIEVEIEDIEIIGVSAAN